YPDHVKGLLAAADLAVRGELRLPGTGGKPAFVGNPPDWHRIANKDKEYLWGLNRMLHWIPLLQAYALSGEARYAEKVVTELDDWLERCPPPPLDAPVKAYDRVNPWRMLEVG